jgi:PHD/YefM family antitoxin component YafN of YafNO toxin-antitoxin module
MYNSVSANLIKTKGVSVFNNVLEKEEEAFISVHGKDKYVVLTLEKYNQLREYELEMALYESKKDLENGNFSSNSIEEHMEKITNG